MKKSKYQNYLNDKQDVINDCKTLLQITASQDIKNLEIINTYYDDHELCIVAKVNTISVELTGVEDEGYFKYTDSDIAFKQLLKDIKLFIQYKCIEELEDIEEITEKFKITEMFTDVKKQFETVLMKLS
jgi:hypothetical protein